MVGYRTAVLAACLCIVGAAACEGAAVTAAATTESDQSKSSGLPANALTSQDGSITGGHCSAALPKPAKTSWRHKLSSPSVTLMGAPNHRLRDVIALPGQAAKMRARVTYGTVDKDLEDENVDLYLQRCPEWQLAATGRSDNDGVVWFNLPANLAPGDYRVRAIVKGDGSTADGTLAVWPKGVQVVVSDVDGTLTTSDWRLPSRAELDSLVDFGRTAPAIDTKLFPGTVGDRHWMAVDGGGILGLALGGLGRRLRLGLSGDRPGVQRAPRSLRTRPSGAPDGRQAL